MRRAGLLLIVLPGLAWAMADPPAAPRAPQHVANFTVEDIAGRKWTLHDLKDLKAVVLYFTGTDCPLANRYIQRVNQLSATFVRKGVIVLAVNPNSLESVEQIRRHQRETGLAVNVFLDRDQRIADQLQVTVTPTVIVADATWRVRYRGLYDDSKFGGHVKQHYVQDAVAALIDGRPVAIPETKPWGCLIQRAAQATPTSVTYAEHVAPVLRRHCVGCHRPDGDAPFSLGGYEAARRWAGTMKHFTQVGQMPPWKPANFGTFHGERRLTARETALLAEWADGGAPRGMGEPAPESPPAAGWALGPPDLILTAPAIDIPAHGDDYFRCCVLPTGLTSERWLRAVAVRPGNCRAVHHVIPWLDTTGAAARLDAADPGPGYPSAGTGPGFDPARELPGWAPGNPSRPLPAGVGIRLPPGAPIVLEMHLHPSGRAETDRTVVGLYFARQPVAQAVHTLEFANESFRIPAGAARHVVTAEHVLAADIHALTVRPRLHQLGQGMHLQAEFPGQQRRTLLHIPRWDFHWQEAYDFREPVALPRGTRLRLEAVYDNSPANPANPHILPRAVTAGPLATDEACAISIQYTKPTENLLGSGRP